MPSSLPISAVSLAVSKFLSMTATLKSRAAKCRQMARPIPWPPPVTTITLRFLSVMIAKTSLAWLHSGVKNCDAATGADPGGARFQDCETLLQVGDAAGSLDPGAGIQDRTQQLNVLGRGGAQLKALKARGGFHNVRSTLLRSEGDADYLFTAEQWNLDDGFQDVIGSEGLLDDAHFCLDSVEVATACLSDIDYHVDLVSPELNAVQRFKPFYFGGVGAQ